MILKNPSDILPTRTGKEPLHRERLFAYLKKGDVIGAAYPTKDPNGLAESDYYLYRLGEEVSIGKIDIVKLIGALSAKVIDTEGYVPHQPLFTTGKELLDLDVIK